MADTQDGLTLTAPDEVAAGSIITMPDGTTYTVKDDHTVAGVARAHFEPTLRDMGYSEQAAQPEPTPMPIFEPAPTPEPAPEPLPPTDVQPPEEAHDGTIGGLGTLGSGPTESGDPGPLS